MSFRRTLSQYAADVDAALVRVFEDLLSEAGCVHPGALEMAEAVRNFTCGPGKRLRPVLMRVAYQGLGGADDEAIVRTSCAVELMQSFLLIHDDIMDRSELRRGQPAVHRRYQARYTKYVRDAQHFGSAMAILAGDLANQLAMLLLGEAPFPPDRVSRAVACCSRIAVDVCYGQVLDMLLPQRPLSVVKREDIWKVMEYKTARYTVEGPLHLGAIFAGAQKGILEQFSAYGVPLGVAFQLQDDILGVFGEETETGKPTASDLTDGKRTLLAVEAWEQGNAEQRTGLASVLGNPTASEEEIKSARRVLEETGARSYVLRIARESAARAKRALASIPLAARERRFLTELADYVVARER
jgi:geranylgeranyl diphosphate synthase type I